MDRCYGVLNGVMDYRMALGMIVGICLGHVDVRYKCIERCVDQLLRGCVWSVYYSLFMYSWVEIQYRKFYRNFGGGGGGSSSTDKNTKTIWSDKECTIEYVLNGGFLAQKGTAIDFNQGFCIYTQLTTNTKRLLYKGIYDGLEEVIPCSYRFLLVEALTTDNQRIKIDLNSSAAGNYYVVGNVFTLDFYRYYLREIVKNESAAESLKSICYMDSTTFNMVEADTVTLIEKGYII